MQNSTAVKRIKYAQASNVIAKVIDSEIFLMSVESEKYFGLDDIGTLIWYYLQKPSTLYELVKILMEDYDIDENSCSQEVSRFLNAMVGKGLVTIGCENA